MLLRFTTEGRVSLRRKFWIAVSLLATVTAITVASVLATAGSGKAAGTNICSLVGTQPNCFTVSILPGQLSASASAHGLILAKFTNQSTATASHTTITVTLPNNVSAVSASPSGDCPAPPFGTTITCTFGNVPGLASVKVSIVFTTTAALGELSGISGTVAFGEGNSNTGSPSNDTFTVPGNPISIVDGTSQAGFCTTSTGSGSLLTTSSANGQTTTIESLSSLLGGLPCTPISGGVLPKDTGLTCGTGACNTQVSFVALPTTGIVTLLFPLSLLPNGMNANKFVLYWFSDTSTIGIPLKLCPVVAAGTDTCIQTQTGVTIGGVKYVKDVLTVFGSPIDPRYSG
jgi:hypothetical protein